MRGLGTSAAALAGAVAGLCLLNSPLRGQQAETVELGESGRPISTVVRLEAPGGTDGARAEFEIRPAEGVRLFGPPTGSVPVREGRVLLPVTFVTGRGESAGSVEAFRVVFRFPGGETAERTVRARVPRELEMEALFTDERSTTVEPGDWVEVSYRVANHGNGPDTVRLSVRVDRDRWEVAAYPRRLVLAPGEAHEGRMRVRAPREARPGSAARAVLRAEGGGEPRRATRTLRVVRSQGWVPGVEELPATVFLGTTTSRRGEDELDSVVGSIHAQGRLNEKTRVALEARLSDDPVTAPAFRGEVRGSSLRLSVERPDWEVRLGDVRGRSRPLAQSHLNARGIDATWEAGGLLEAELLAGVPAEHDREDGHNLMATLEAGWPVGHVGLTASSQTRSSRLAGEGIGGSVGRETGDRETARSLGLFFERDRAEGDQLRLEAGLMRLAPAAEAAEAARTGPAAELGFSRYREATAVDLRARKVPGTLSRTVNEADELYLSGRRRLVPGLDAIARASLNSVESLETSGSADTREATAGLRWRLGSARLDALLGYSERIGRVGETVESRERQTVTGLLGLPIGPLSVDVTAEVGREEAAAGAGSEAFERYRTSVRAYRSTFWGSVTGSREESATFGTRFLASAQGGVRLRPLELEWGVDWESGETGTALGSDRVRAWGRVGYELREDLALVAGMEREPDFTGSDDLEISFGLRKGISVPTPVRTRPVAEIVVFADRNGDGRRNEGEPSIPGVRLRVGWLEAVTPETGSIEVTERDLRGRPIEVVTTSLPPGSLLRTARVPHAEEKVEIPVVPSGTLQLDFFFDRDGDGERDPGELRVDDVRVLLVGPDGSRRAPRTNDEGTVTAEGLVPGVYEVRATVPGDRRHREVSRRFEVEVAPGQVSGRRLPLPPAVRGIRYQSSP